MIITDQDPRCHNVVELAVKNGVFPNTQHCLCEWHEVNRNCTLSAKKHENGAIDENYVLWIINRSCEFAKTLKARRKNHTESKKLMHSFKIQSQKWQKHFMNSQQTIGLTTLRNCCQSSTKDTIHSLQGLVFIVCWRWHWHPFIFLSTDLLHKGRHWSQFIFRVWNGGYEARHHGLHAKQWIRHFTKCNHRSHKQEIDWTF